MIISGTQGGTEGALQRLWTRAAGGEPAAVRRKLAIRHGFQCEPLRNGRGAQRARKRSPMVASCLMELSLSWTSSCLSSSIRTATLTSSLSSPGAAAVRAGSEAGAHPRSAGARAGISGNAAAKESCRGVAIPARGQCGGREAEARPRQEAQCAMQSKWRRCRLQSVAGAGLRSGPSAAQGHLTVGR